MLVLTIFLLGSAAPGGPCFFSASGLRESGSEEEEEEEDDDDDEDDEDDEDEPLFFPNEKNALLGAVSRTRTFTWGTFSFPLSLLPSPDFVAAVPVVSSLIDFRSERVHWDSAVVSSSKMYPMHTVSTAVFTMWGFSSFVSSLSFQLHPPFSASLSKQR